jgi:hypothetical protein
MWQEHPSIQVGGSFSYAEQERLEAYKLLWKEPHANQAQKSAKTVFFEENDKGSSPKWGDQDDEEIPSAQLWNYNATNEENASSSAATPAEKSKDGSLSGKEEKDSSAEESQPLSEAGQRLVSMMKPDTAEKFKAFLKDKLHERQHSLSDPNSSGCVNPPASPRETSEDEVVQVDSQGNSLGVPPHVRAPCLASWVVRCMVAQNLYLPHKKVQK